MNNEITIEDLGYSEYFVAGRSQLGLNNLPVARVVAEFKAAYRVKNSNGEYLAKITGKKMFNSSAREDYPAVGDWVAIADLSGKSATIREILPRRTLIKRSKNEPGGTKIVATNIDVAFIVESVARDYNLNRFERYFAICANGGVKPAIILNKIDLLSQEELDEKLAQLKNRFPGMTIISASTVDRVGLGELKRYISKGKTYCFLGSSGVGKSSLINMLIGHNEIKTGAIGSASGRGKHITSSRQMYLLEDGGMVIDNPGMREVGMAEVSEGVDNFFNEITALAKQCKYSDCTHTHEPDCAVNKAVESGQLDEGQHANYVKLKKETDYYEMSEVEKREKSRQFGKFMKKAKEELERNKHD